VSCVRVFVCVYDVYIYVCISIYFAYASCGIQMNTREVNMNMSFTTWACLPLCVRVFVFVEKICF
jgi:hypothetical protein